MRNICVGVNDVVNFCPSLYAAGAAVAEFVGKAIYEVAECMVPPGGSSPIRGTSKSVPDLL